MSAQPESTMYTLPADTRMGKVVLSVSNLAASEAFYTRMIGFERIAGSANYVDLGCGGITWLRLQPKQGAVRKTGVSGLYHFAILTPNRRELGSRLRHLAEHGVQFSGFADHAVSEALYLDDPDGHGIEIYADRPRDQWVDAQGKFRMTTDPLDLDSLLKAGAGLDGNQPLSEQTGIGHVHLHTAHIPDARRFYVDCLGFDLMYAFPHALFVSAGGYHHHMGLNTWAGVGAPPAPPDSLRLETYEIVVPAASDLEVLNQRLTEAGWPVDQDGQRLSVLDPAGVPVTIITQ